jgi:hypothetical protein
MGLAAMLVVPYLLAMGGVNAPPPRHPMVVVVAVVGVQGSVLGFLLAWAGLAVGAGLGLDSPAVRAWVEGRRSTAPRHWISAALLGLVTGAVVLALDHAFFAIALPGAPRPLRWQGALASLYGGIAEEVMTRLFLMTLVAWCLSKLTRRASPAVFIAAAVLAALAFGAGHLPATARLFGALTVPLVTRALVLNGIPGVVFGLLFWRRGLESAMVAHFSADVVLHVVGGG